MRKLAWLFATMWTVGAHSADKITLQLRAIATQPPEEVVLQQEGEMQSQVFVHGAGNAYQVELALPPAAAGSLSIPYRLVASWADGKEQFFLKMYAALPPTIALKVYRNQVAFDADAMLKIEALGTDYDSLLEKYCRSRAFHRYWRQQGQADYYNALRSARVWFDSATSLAIRPNSPFRMDEEIKDIMDSYEARAKGDAHFRDRYRKYASTGYVTAMLDQVKASEYSFVASIPVLAGKGMYTQAYELNTLATTALKAESNDDKKKIVRHQGVDLKMLKGNEEFLGAKVQSKSIAKEFQRDRGDSFIATKKEGRG